MFFPKILDNLFTRFTVPTIPKSTKSGYVYLKKFISFFKPSATVTFSFISYGLLPLHAIYPYFIMTSSLKRVFLMSVPGPTKSTFVKAHRVLSP